jgi:chemotaxis protein CheD
MGLHEKSQSNQTDLPHDYLPSLTEVGGNLPKHYLIPGTLFVSSEPCLITTVLGSAIAVCLWDNSLQIGGMNHFTQPDGEIPCSTKYARAANEELLWQMLQMGADPTTLTASIFGGSLPAIIFGNVGKCLGECNLNAAEKFLAQQKIGIRKRETGGVKGRKLVFQTSDGKTWAQQL